MVEKKEDAEMTCLSCGTDLVCHMSKYEGGFENKLQWQNSDGTAHYKWKSAGKYDCIIPNDDNTQEEKGVESDKEPTATTQTSLDLLDEGTKKLIRNETVLLCHLRKEIESVVKGYVTDPNPAMIGQYVGLIWSKYFGVKV